MTKKDFIALADAIKTHNDFANRPFSGATPFTEYHLNTLATFFRTQHRNFNPSRWLDYIAGKCGPNGGQLK